MDDYAFDVFLSHSRSEKSAVEEIAERLEAKFGIRVFLDRWHLIPGEPWQEALEQALASSKSCAVFVGPSGIGPWENEEMRAALEQAVYSRSFRVIPVLLPGADLCNPSVLPAFLRRRTWVQFGDSVDDDEAIRLLAAGIQGKPPRQALLAPAGPQFPSRVVHSLTPAPLFVGRKSELRRLAELWNGGRPHVVSLVGLGGSGKTAIAAEFVSAVLGLPSIGYETEKLDPAEGCFIWSFYVDQDVGAFLAEAYRYFSGGRSTDAKGSSAIYQLTDVLARGGHHLIVMDGLERVQRAFSDERKQFGELDEPMLRQFVRRMALGVGDTACLITSRFPLADIDSWSHRGYYPISIDDLTSEDARLLIECHGIQAADTVVEAAIKDFGTHALTLDYLCTYVLEYCAGDLRGISQFPEPDVSSDSKVERRLAQVLQAYETALSKPELALLSLISVFRYGTNVETVKKVFADGERDIAGAIRALSLRDLQRIVLRLQRLHLVLNEGSDRYTSHPAVKDHFYRLFRHPERLHGAVKRHFADLTNLPGVELPESKSMLDQFEEIVYHAIRAGSPAEAEDVYRSKLGGAGHLGFHLGDYTRGLRVLQAFSSCPCKVDMATYLRGVGSLAEALEWYRKAGEYNGWRSGVYPVLFLMGLLPEIARLAEDASASILHQANALRGRLGQNVYPGFYTNRQACIVLPHLAYHFGARTAEIIGSISAASLPAQPEPRYEQSRDRMERLARGEYDTLHGNDEQACRCRLAKAELCRKAADLAGCAKKIEESAPWIMRSGSQELLCLLHLTRARLHSSRKEMETARSALVDALHVARSCQFTLYHIDASNELARTELALGNADCAEQAARSALNGVQSSDGQPAPAYNLPTDMLLSLGANHPDCDYSWGAAEAGVLLAQALLAQGRLPEGREQLIGTIELQTHIRDPRVVEAQRLLKHHHLSG